LVLLRADAHPAGGGDPGLVVTTEPLAIACESGVIRVAELMQEGRAATRAEEFLRGYPIRVGDRLT
jgi:methionyl-tRNA formyltransferase